MTDVSTQEVGAAVVPPLDFDKIDALRRHMLLTKENMAELFGVSRITYYTWLKGSKPHKKREEKIRVLLRKLVQCVAKEKWPMPSVFVAEQPDRLLQLQELLATIE